MNSPAGSSESHHIHCCGLQSRVLTDACRCFPCILRSQGSEACAGENASRRLLRKGRRETLTAEEEHARYQRCCKQLGTRLARASRKFELVRSSRNLFHNKKRKTSGLTHGDDFVVTGTKGVFWSSRSSLESVYPIKASIIGSGSAKSIKALSRRTCWGETALLYQHDPRHVDVLVESLERENGNTMQTLTVDDVKDENPVSLDPEQISKNNLMWSDACS